MVTNLMEDTYIDDITASYGATVQMHPKHILPGDYLDFELPLVGGFTPTYMAMFGAMFIRDDVPSPISTTRYYTKFVRFHTSQPRRTQIKFGIVYWTSVGSQELLFDFEHRHVYRTISSPTALNWTQSYEACRSLGRDWYMLAINDIAESDFVGRNLSGLVKVPLGMRANNDTGPYMFYWVNKNEMTFLNWKSPPIDPSVTRCAEMNNASNGEWVGVNCTEVYNNVMCENDYHRLFYQLSYVGWESVYPTAYTSGITIFVAANLPADNAATVYGTTVHQPMSQCRPADRYIMRQSNDLINVDHERPEYCSLVFTGDATVKEYNQVLKGLRWVGFNHRRKTLKFNYILWTVPNLRNIYRDITTGHVYAAFASKLAQIVPASYPYYPMFQQCNRSSSGFYPAALESRSEADAQLPSQTYGDMLLGALKFAASFVWNATGNLASSATTANFSLWAPYEPAGTEQCVVQSSLSGDWTNYSCSVPAYSISCENDTMTYAGTGTVTVPNSILLGNDTLLRVLGTSMATVTVSSTDSSAIGGVTVYGATVHTALFQCVSSIKIGLLQMLLDVVVTYNDTTCALTISCVNTNASGVPISNMKAQLDQLYLNTSFVGGMGPTQITFAVIFWSEPAMSVYADVETRHVFREFSLGGTKTWRQSWAACRALGRSWTLPTVTNINEALALSASPVGSRTALGLYRLTTGSSVNFTFAKTGEYTSSYMNWAASEPSSADEAAMLNKTDNLWYGSSSTAPTFTHVTCETDFYALMYVVSRTAATATKPHKEEIAMFVLSPPAAATTSTIYGATIVQKYVTVHPTDKYLLSKSNEFIAVAYEAPGMIQFVGVATHSYYNDFLSGVILIGGTGLRVQRKFAAIMWNVPEIRDVVIDPESLHVYTQFAVSWSVQTPAYYNVQAYQFCRLNGMYPAEIGDRDEYLTSLRTLRYGNSALGALRTTFSNFVWQTSLATVTYNAWTPQMPSWFSTDNLLTQTTGGWTSVPTSTLLHVTCEADAWNSTFVVTYTQANSAVPTPTTVRLLSFDNMTVFNTSVDFASFADGTPIYGATVQIALFQCLAGDMLYLNVSGLAPELQSVVSSYDSTVCALFVTGTLSVEKYKVVLDRVVFGSSNAAQHIQVSFAAVLWPYSGLTSMMMDVDKRIVYGRTTLGSASAYSVPYSTCQGVSPMWSLPTVRTNEQLLVTAVNISTLQPLALGLQRGPTFGMRFLWQDHTAAQFANWITGHPLANTSAENCTKIIAGTNSWQMVACSATAFTNVLCQYDGTFPLSFVVSFTAPSTIFPPATMTTVPFSSAAQLPASSGATWYGATVMMPVKQCLSGDHFILTKSHDAISVLYDTMCVVQVVGPTSDAEYCSFVQGVTYHGHLLQRSLLSFGYVFWTSAATRDMVIEYTSQKTFSVFKTNGFYDTRGTYPYDAMKSLCFDNNMRPLEAPTAQIVSDHVRLQKYGNMYIGARRVANTAAFVWQNSTLPVSNTTSSWKPFHPQPSSSLMCVLLTQPPFWDECQCSWDASPVSSIGCEALSPDNRGVINITAVPIVPDERRVRFINTAGPTNVTNTSIDANFLLDGPAIYGVTVHVAAFRCLAGDVLSVALSDIAGTTGLTATYVASACALFIKSDIARNASDYKKVLDAVQFTTTAEQYSDRTQITFAFVFWDSPLAFNYTMDVDRRGVFGVFNSGVSLDWEGAWKACRSLGFTWELPTITTREEQLAASMNIAEYDKNPLSLLKSPSGLFTWFAKDEIYRYYNWKVGEPNTANSCAQFTSGDGAAWSSVACSTAQYKRFLCKQPAPPMQYAVSFLLHESYHKSTTTSVIFSIPASSGVAVYGATVHAKADQCQPGDAFAFRQSNDYISVSFERNCAMGMVGQRDIAEYTTVLNSIVFRGQLFRRSVLKYAYVFWTHPNIRDMLYDMDTTTAYTLFTIHAPYEPPNSATIAAPLFCTANGLTGVDLPTLATAMEQIRTISEGEMFIAATRVSYNKFNWTTSNTSMSFGMWAPFYPTNTAANKCVKLTYMNYWKDTLCSAQLDHIGCKSTTWPDAGATQINYPPASWDPTKVRLISATNHQPSNSTEDANWFEDGPKIYGLTVQIASYQCAGAADTLSVDLSSLPNSADVTVSTINGSCILFMNAATPKSVTFFKNATDLVRFSTTTDITNRIQITFAVLYWTHSGVRRLVMDADKGSVFGFVTPGTNKTWEQSYDLCRSYGYDWNLPRATSLEKHSALLADSAAAPTPLGFFYDNDTKQFVWVTGDEVIFNAWDASKPTAPSAANCTEIQSTRKWNNVAYKTSSYSTVICEVRRHIMKYTVSFITLNALFTAQISRGVFNSTYLPASSSTPIYGATVQDKADQYRSGDRIVMTTSNDVISQSYDTNGVVNFLGPATVTDYNKILSGLLWKGQLMRRTKLSFAYIYWSNVYVRNMIYDLDTGHAYNSYAATASMAARTVYPEQLSSSTMCTLHSMNITEVTSLTESLEQMRTQRFGEMYLGGSRFPTTTTFRWTTSNANLTYQMWRPLRPMASTTSRNCIKQSAQFDWEDVLCNESVPSIGCEADSWTLAGSVSYDYPPTSWDPTKVRLISATNHQPSNSTEDANWFEDGPKIYGLTVQMASYQCAGAADTLSVDLSSLPNSADITVSTINGSCILFMNASTPKSVTFFKNATDLVRFNTTSPLTNRIQITFAVLYWTDSSVRRLVMDADKGSVFGFVTPGTNKTWEQSYDLCRSYGYDWNLPTVASTEKVAALKSNLAEILKIPLGLVLQAASTQFGWLTSEELTYAEWDTNNPTSPQGALCAEIQTNGKWRNMNCSAPSYSTVICEARRHIMKYTVSFITLDTLFTAQISRGVFNSTYLPASSSTPIYGATVQDKADQYRSGDRIVMTTSERRASHNRTDTNGVVNFLGPATVTDYNKILSGLLWKGQLMRRTKLSFAYIYWSNVYVRNMIYDLDTGHAYNAYAATASMAARTVYPEQLPTSTMCTLHSMNITEVTSLTEEP